MDITKDKVLYLDNDKLSLETFTTDFSAHYNVLVAENKEDADNILERDNIKVAISNLHLPVVNGIEYIKELNKRYPEIVCIITSESSHKESLYKTTDEIEIFGFIEKPWNKIELHHLLKNATNKYNLIQEKTETQSKLEQALEKAEQSDRLKLEFLSTISHEVRTPLNGIIGFSDLLKINKHLDKQSKEYLDIIMISANRLTALVDDMVTAARIHAGDINVSNHDIYLNELLDKLHRKFLPEIHLKGNINFKVKRHKGLRKIAITTDVEKLYSIFDQLIRNAIKFTEKGTIEFGVHNEEAGILFIKDTGNGISEYDQLKVFDLFSQGTQKLYSAQIDGVGIGLSIVKGLVKLLKGEIWFETEENVGTTFYFKIPLVKKSLANLTLRERQVTFLPEML